jgi:hypothetical protein
MEVAEVWLASVNAVCNTIQVVALAYIAARVGGANRRGH